MRLAVFLANGFEEVEAVTVIDYLRRAGTQVDIVSVPTTEPTSLDYIVGAHDVKMAPDIDLDTFLSTSTDNLPDAIYLPGGMPGATNLADNQKLIDFINACSTAGKIISAICAAPAIVLTKTNALAGKHFTCYPGMQNEISSDDIKSMYIENTPVVVDDNLITGAGPGCAGQLAIELILKLYDDQTAQNIRISTIQV